MKAFTQRSGKMKGYPEDTRYMAVNCGGCCGAGIDVKIENLEKRLLANGEKKEDVVIHLSTCICSENHHRLPCPFKNYLKKTIARRGFPVIEGTYLSKTASRKRAEGIYQPFE
jgi:predicted metal-binding protein